MDKLDTIMDSDCIAVLDKGKLVQFDSPEKLLAEEGCFRDMYNTWSNRRV